MKKKLIAIFVSLVLVAVGAVSVPIVRNIMEERELQKEEEIMLDMLKRINNKQYYAKTHSSEYGEFYWIYDFEWDAKHEEGTFKRSAYYANQTPVYCKVLIAGSLYPCELRQYGAFNMENGNWITAWNTDGYTLDGNMLSRSGESFEFILSSTDKCVYINDSRGSRLLPGTPWNDLPADYDEPILLCKQTDRENWFFWTESETGASADIFFSNEDNPSEVIMDIDDPGENSWSVQAKYENITLKKDHKYRVSFDYVASVYTGAQQRYVLSEHKAEFGFIQNYDPYFAYYTEELDLQSHYSQPYYQHVETTFIMTYDTDQNVFCAFSFGGLGNVGALVKIANFKLEELS